ncbi:MAG: hypothetical protein OQK35_02495 [Alphaproteobacteria bacterium]|nr:hypothetical protein [Rhodospirillales bacterium]MCW9045178.1 hypothetical protein [Alphaproteobacteria bacterium]
MAKVAKTHLQSQESLLLDYVHRLEKLKKGRRAVHVHISRLMPYNRRDNHLQSALNTFDGIVKTLNGQVFLLKNTDLILVYKEGAKDDVETAIVKLRFLFSDDPLLEEKTQERKGREFCTWYNVEAQYDEFLYLARELVSNLTVAEAKEQGLDAEDAFEEAPVKPQDPPMTPKVLAQVSDALMRADLSNMMRRQYVCSITGEGAPQDVFSELYISIPDLRDTLLPGIGLTGNRWLFQHLTETLDHRVLSLLGKTDERSFTGDISINLNVATLLTKEFLNFDDAVIASMRGGIVLELQLVDIFANLNDFQFAREFVKDRGYRLCIDGIDYNTLRYIDRERMGIDLIKLNWSPELLVTEDIPLQEMREVVSMAGEARMILARCDDRDAIEYGQSVGIKLFQGRHVETLIAEESRRRNMHKRIRLN